MFIDSHAHLTSPDVYPDIELILARAKDAGIEAIMNICTNPDTLQKGLELSKRYPWVYNSAATTPHDVGREGEEVFSIIAECARNGHLKAIGETGLDYYYTHSPKETQKAFLIRYFHLALECKLPVVIHCRDAFADFFDILDAEYAGRGRGVLHCFTGTIEEAQEVLKRDWYLSLSGIVTFKKSIELKEVAKLVPLNRLLIETDTPYLAPQSHRGKRNEPAYVTEVAKLVAEVKGISLEEVAESTAFNARQLFNL